MGLFNIFKKKEEENTEKRPLLKSKTSIPNPRVRNAAASYTPWPDKKNSNTPFSNANFLNWANGQTIPKDNDGYPRKMSYLYDIPQPLKKHRQMIQTGFLVHSTLAASLEKLRAQELKDILTQNGKPTSGKKALLIQRILESVDVTSLNIPDVYILSQKGVEFLEKYKYYLNLDRHLTDGEITIPEFDTIKSAQPYLSQMDVIWKNLQQRDLVYFKKKNYGSLRNNELSRYRILMEENRINDAAYHLLIVFYYDLSGMGNNGTICNFEDLSIAPGLIESLKEVKKFINSKTIHRIYDEVYVPFRYFEEGIFIQIISDILNDKVDLSKFKNKANFHR